MFTSTSGTWTTLGVGSQDQVLTASSVDGSLRPFWLASAGGATAWDDIGDADSAATILFAGHDQDITSAEDGGDILTIGTTDEDQASNTTILRLFTNDTNDTNTVFLEFTNDDNGTPIEAFHIKNTGTLGGIEMELGNLGVLVTTDGDGQITFLSQGGGNNEDWTINLDDTANTIVHGTGTGVTVHDWGTIGITTGGTITLDAGNGVRFGDADNSQGVTFSATSVITTSQTYFWPVADGTNGQVLHTNGNGDLEWAADDGAGSSPWTTNADIVQLDTPGQQVVIGGTASGGKLFIDGDADEIQFLVQGNSTQTSDLVRWENSGGDALITFDNTGSMTATSGAIFTHNGRSIFAATATSIEIAERIVHQGDPDTYISFDDGGNSMSMVVGNTVAWSVTPAGGNVFNGNTVALNFVVRGDTVADLFQITGSTDSVRIGDTGQFAIPDSATCTADSTGEICLDTTDNQLILFGGSEQVLTGNRQKEISFVNPTASSVRFMGKLQDGMTITDVHCIVDPENTLGDTLGMNVMECTSSGDSCVSFDAEITCTETGAEDDGSLSNATFDAGDWWAIQIGTASGTITNAVITVYYNVVRE